MSSHTSVQAPSDPGRLPMTLPLLAEKKRLGEPIVMVTAYDYPSARSAEAAGVDLVLVGDSAATTVLGYNSTTPVELSDMLVLARAARRGLRTPLLIGDMPFGSYEVSDEQAITNALRMVKEAGCEAVKLEGGGSSSVSRARAIVGAGIPVMGHVGLTPQTATALGGWKAQGRTAAAAAQIAAEALALQDAGCFALVFEAIPAAVTEELMPKIEIPVIGIGAGPATDGQVLVFHDLLGIRDGLGARFVKRYANLQDEMNAGVAAYVEDVRSRRYPGPEHTYSIDPAELAELHELLVVIDLPEHPGGCASGDRVWLDVARDDAVRTDHAALAYAHAAGHHHVRAQPAVIPDPRRALRLKSLPRHRLLGVVVAVGGV